MKNVESMPNQRAVVGCGKISWRTLLFGTPVILDENPGRGLFVRSITCMVAALVMMLIG